MQGIDRLRLELENDGRHVIRIVSGEKGWARRAGMSTKLPREAVSALIQQTYLEAIPITLVAIRAKGLSYMATADEKVGDKPAAVLKVTGPDGKDFSLYFDKDSRLPVKVVAKTPNFFENPGKMWLSEITFADYKDFDGIKKATRVEFKTDGEIAYVIEITEFKVLDNVDPATFAEPK